MLELDGVGRVVSLLRVVGVVAEEVDGLPAFEVDEHEVRATVDAAAPREPGLDDGVLDDGRGGGDVRTRCSHDAVSLRERLSAHHPAMSGALDVSPSSRSHSA